MAEEAEAVDAEVVLAPASLAEAWIRGYFLAPDLECEGGAAWTNLNNNGIWTLSGARAGNGIDALLDTDMTTLWQSDGMAPHIVTVQFYQRTSIAEIALYLDFKMDESYTPSRIAIKAGTTQHDLQTVAEVTVEEPIGWVRIPVGKQNGVGIQRFLRTWYLQVVISEMHQNGRDCHIRCAQIRGPAIPGADGARSSSTSGAASKIRLPPDRFQGRDLAAWGGIR